MLFSKKPKQIWKPGDFVQVIMPADDEPPFAHAGEVGVVIQSHPPHTDERSGAYGLGWYHKVWFGDWTDPLLKGGVHPCHNWRGYYDEYLEKVDDTTLWMISRS